MPFRLHCWLIFTLAISQVHTDGGFERNKKYTYTYHAVHATGLPNHRPNQLAGRHYHATLTLQYDEEGDFVFQIHDFDSVGFNKRSDSFQNNLPYSETNRMPNTHLLKDDMEKAFRVAYKNGQIKSISVLEDTDLSILNMKKALASLFQLNLQPYKQSGSYVYQLQEDGIGGDCQTTYYIQNEASDSEMITVIKTRLYDQCNHRPHMFSSSITGHKCPHCEHASTESLGSFAHIKYQIKDPALNSTYTIEKIDSNGVVRFTPFTNNGQTVTSLVNQTLTLIKIEDVCTKLNPIYLPGKYEAFSTLSYEFLNDRATLDAINLKEQHYYYTRLHDYHDAKTEQNDAKTEAESSLLSVIKELNLDDPSSCIIPLVAEFRKMSYDDFVYFFDKNVKFIDTMSKLKGKPDPATADEQNIRDLLMRVLPMTGTNPSILFMLKLVREEKMLYSHATNALSTFAFYVKEPSEKLLDYLAVIVGNETARMHIFGMFVRGYNELESMFVLAFGTLVFKGCVKGDFNSHPAYRETYIREEKCNKYVEMLLHLREEKSWRISPSTFLMAISNTHHDRTFPFLLDVFQNGPKLNTEFRPLEGPVHMFRLAALWGLWSFLGDPIKNEKIATVSASVFFNTTEDHQIRIYAFYAWMFATPTAAFYVNLVDILAREPNDKVASFIYQVITVVSNSMDPCFAVYKQHARHVLQLIPPREYDVLNHGFMHHFSVFNGKYNYGRVMDLNIHPGNNSFVPRDVYFKHSVNLLGYHFDIMEAGVTGISCCLASDLGFLMRWNVRTPQPDQISILKNIRGSGEYKKRQTFPDAKIFEYMRVFNQFAVYTRFPKINDFLVAEIGDSLTDPVDHNAIEEAFERNHEGKGYATIIFNFRKNLLNFVEVEGTIPNEMGLPVVLSFRLPMGFKMHGSVGIYLEKSNISSDRVAELNLNWNFKARANVHLHGSMHVDSAHFYRSGYRIDTSAGLNLPVNTTVAVNFEGKKLMTKYVPLVEPFDILHYDSKPVTFDHASKLPVAFSEKPTQKTYHTGHKYFGLGVTFNFTYDNKWNDYSSYRYFFKTFFTKINSYEDYSTLGKKLFAGAGNFLNHALFNPTGKPFHANVQVAPCKDNPTTEVLSNFIMEQADIASDTFLNATGWKYQLKVEAKGPHPRTWSARFGIKKSWPYRNIRQAFFHFLRTTIPEIDKDPLQVCFQSEHSIENLSSIFALPLPRKMSDIRWNYDASIKVGKSCEDRYKKISITSVGQKSEMLQNIKAKDVPIYGQCEKDTQNGYQFSQSCWEVMKDMGRLDEFRFLIQYYNISEEFKALASIWLEWFHRTFYNHLEGGHVDTSHKDNQIELLANFSYFDPILDVKITLPYKTENYRDIFVPSILPHFEPLSMTEYVYDRYLRQVFNYHKPLCILSGDYVRTVDNVVYRRTSDPNCYYLAFGNIITENGIVLVTSQSTKIHLFKDIIEITGSGSSLSLLINGEKQVIDERKPFKLNLRDFDRDFNEPATVCPVVIFKYYNGYVVNSPEHQLVVYFDGHNLKIQTSPYFYGHTTGLCGHYDGDKGKEFVSLDGTVHENVDDFVKSYALLQDGCSP